MAYSFLEKFNAARRASCPLLVVRTPDCEATINTIAQDGDNMKAPIARWDGVQGLAPVNDPPGVALIRRLQSLPNCNNPDAFVDPVVMLKSIIKDGAPVAGRKDQDIGYVPKESIIFALNMHRYLNIAEVIQAIWNVRDKFKQNARMLVLLCPDITLPPELSNDVLVLDEPLPNEKQLEKLVNDTYEAAGPSVLQATGKKLADPKPEFVSHCVDALSGLPYFPAETVCAMSIGKDGMDLDQLWERKRQTIEQTMGLSIWRGNETFNDVVGLDNVKQYHRLRGSGPHRRRGVVFIDEIDKHLGGFGAVGTGDTTTEMVGALLTYMQDIEAEGSLFLGIAGGGKTLLARAIANEWGVPLINYDLSGMKGSLVGQSGQNIRIANKVVSAVTQGNAYFLATCNRIENLPPELRRRFKSATFFFDLMNRKEKDAAWDYYEKKYDVKGKHPDDAGWTASEINNCCYNAWVLSISLEDAGKYIIPISTSASDEIVRLRKQADNKFISASYTGPYKAPDGLEEPEPPMFVAIAAIPQPKRSVKIAKEEADPRKKPN